MGNSSGNTPWVQGLWVTCKTSIIIAKSFPWISGKWANCNYNCILSQIGSLKHRPNGWTWESQPQYPRSLDPCQIVIIFWIAVSILHVIKLHHRCCPKLYSLGNGGIVIHLLDTMWIGLFHNPSIQPSINPYGQGLGGDNKPIVPKFLYLCNSQQAEAFQVAATSQVQYFVMWVLCTQNYMPQLQEKNVIFCLKNPFPT